MPLFGKNGVSGDLYVRLQVAIPKNLSEKELGLFRKLKELKNNHVFNYN